MCQLLHAVGTFVSSCVHKLSEKSLRDRRLQVGQRPGFSSDERLGQYSDASMIVSTRVVTAGSAGLSEPYSMLLS